MSAPSNDRTDAAADGHYVAVATLDTLPPGRSRIVRVGPKQILLSHTDKGLFACNNRCPHEGYPLKEGTLSDGCVLTCNWHNWKFDLTNGANLTGGDALRCYPIRVEDGEILIEVTDPPAEERIEKALAGLQDSFRRFEYDRMGREIARLAAVGTDPLTAVRHAFAWTHDHFEYGATHAQAAAADWLALRAQYGDDDDAHGLVPLVEIVSHLAWDSLRERAYPFATAAAEFDGPGLTAAIEAEDEPAAIAIARGGIALGQGFAPFLEPLARAALAHYADFGHSAIYVLKTAQLSAALGEESLEPLVLALVRQSINAFREDKIPEFKDYEPSLKSWDGSGTAAVTAADFVGLGVRDCLALALNASAQPQQLYDALLGAAAWNFLHYDMAHQSRTAGPVSDNKGWLDFTHALTFANAVRNLGAAVPDLWPAGLLQIACFVGRNAAYVDKDIDTAPWQIADNQAADFMDQCKRGLFDHGRNEPIVACHLVKLVMAVADEIADGPTPSTKAALLTSLNRFLNAPLKRRHALRVARQSIDFVAREG